MSKEMETSTVDSGIVESHTKYNASRNKRRSKYSRPCLVWEGEKCPWGTRIETSDIDCSKCNFAGRDLDIIDGHVLNSGHYDNSDIYYVDRGLRLVASNMVGGKLSVEIARGQVTIE